MNESITIWQSLLAYAAGQAVTVALAYWWAVRSWHRGYEASEWRFERQHSLRPSSFLSSSATRRNRHE